MIYKDAFMSRELQIVTSFVLGPRFGYLDVFGLENKLFHSAHKDARRYFTIVTFRWQREDKS